MQEVLLRLDKAFQACFTKSARYPKFKRREKYNSIVYPQYGGFQLKAGKLLLSFIGAIRIRIHQIPVGTLKRCTIVRDVDQWFCCITTDDGIDGLAEKYQTTRSVGIDVGLLNWLTLSDGRKIPNTLNFESHTRKIRQLQRDLARKKKGSRSREKTRIQLAKAWRKVRRCRDDFVHKASTSLAKEGYTLIAFERLNIDNMVKNHNLAQAIMDATWGKLREYTARKVEQCSGRVVTVNPTGTSQKCSRCGEVAKEKLGLSIRMFECKVCGLVLDRDVNAALNILKLGLERAHAEAEPLLVRRKISKFSQGSKKLTPPR